MKRIDTTIAEGKGTVDNVDNWGKRKLAYEINGLTDGDYTLIDFHADPADVAELDRVLRITDAVGAPHDRQAHGPRLGDERGPGHHPASGMRRGRHT